MEYYGLPVFELLLDDVYHALKEATSLLAAARGRGRGLLASRAYPESLCEDG
jgi:hypothetical protein